MKSISLSNYIKAIILCNYINNEITIEKVVIKVMNVKHNISHVLIFLVYY